MDVLQQHVLSSFPLTVLTTSGFSQSNSFVTVSSNASATTYLCPFTSTTHSSNQDEQKFQGLQESSMVLLSK